MSEQDEPPKRFVIYRGARMIEGWPEKIRAAQTVTHYDIGGVDFERIRYGDESDDWGANKRPCHDCRVIQRGIPRRQLRRGAMPKVRRASHFVRLPRLAA